MDNTRDTNILANLVSILINLLLGSIIINRYRFTKSEAYQAAFRLVAPALLMSMVGAAIFAVLYILHLLVVIDDHTLQHSARLVVLFFYFFIPASIYFSLQYFR